MLYTPLIVSVFAPYNETHALCVRVTFVPFPAINVGEADVPESIQRIEKLLNTNIEFHDLDLLDKAGLEKLFKQVRKLQERILLQDLRADCVGVGEPLRITSSFRCLCVVAAFLRCSDALRRPEGRRGVSGTTAALLQSQSYCLH